MTTSGTWRLAGCRDYGRNTSTLPLLTANQYDAIGAVELALADYERTVLAPDGR